MISLGETNEIEQELIKLYLAGQVKEAEQSLKIVSLKFNDFSDLLKLVFTCLSKRSQTKRRLFKIIPCYLNVILRILTQMNDPTLKLLPEFYHSLIALCTQSVIDDMSNGISLDECLVVFNCDFRALSDRVDLLDLDDYMKNVIDRVKILKTRKVNVLQQMYPDTIKEMITEVSLILI